MKARQKISKKEGEQKRGREEGGRESGAAQATWRRRDSLSHSRPVYEQPPQP